MTEFEPTLRGHLCRFARRSNHSAEGQGLTNVADEIFPATCICFPVRGAFWWFIGFLRWFVFLYCDLSTFLCISTFPVLSKSFMWSSSACCQVFLCGPCGLEKQQQFANEMVSWKYLIVQKCCMKGQMQCTQCFLSLVSPLLLLFISVFLYHLSSPPSSYIFCFTPIVLLFLSSPMSSLSFLPHHPRLPYHDVSSNDPWYQRNITTSLPQYGVLVCC